MEGSSEPLLLCSGKLLRKIEEITLGIACQEIFHLLKQVHHWVWAFVYFICYWDTHILLAMHGRPIEREDLE